MIVEDERLHRRHRRRASARLGEAHAHLSRMCLLGGEPLGDCVQSTLCHVNDRVVTRHKRHSRAESRVGATLVGAETRDLGAQSSQLATLRGSSARKFDVRRLFLEKCEYGWTESNKVGVGPTSRKNI